MISFCHTTQGGKSQISSIAYRDRRVSLRPAQRAIASKVSSMRINSYLDENEKWDLCNELLIRAGVRSGKTWGASYTAFQDAISLSGGGDYLVAGPTWTKCKEVAREAFLFWARPYCTLIRDRFCILINGIKVHFMGLHKPAAVDGLTLRGAWVDEIKDCKKLAIEKVGERVLTTNGIVIYTTTPTGYDFIFEMFEGEERGAPGLRETINFTTYDGIASKEAIEKLASKMDERTYNQQILGLYVQFSGRVFYNWEKEYNLVSGFEVGGRSYSVDYNPNLPVALFMDFNVDPMSGGLGQIHNINGDKYATIFDEIVIDDSHTQQFLDVALERSQQYGIPKKKITVYPDPTGGQRRSEAGYSNFVVIKRHNQFKMKARPPGLPKVVDRLAATNSMIKRRDGTRHLFVHPRCKKLPGCFQKLPYKEGTNEPDKSLGLDHLPDGAGYWLELECPITFDPKKKKSKGMVMG